MNATHPSCGTHMKKSAALAFIEKYPNYSYYKVRNSAGGKDYVITSQMKFIGRDGNIVSDIKLAKCFSSVDDAFLYLDDNCGSIDREISRVINEEFVSQKRPNISQANDKTLEPLEAFSYAHMGETDRINIPKKIRDEIYKCSNGTCAICGRSLTKYNYTIDHIVPLSRGGTNEAANLRAVHFECNKLKGSFTDRELSNNINSIICGNIYNDPNSAMATMAMRSFLRGVIKNYGSKNTNTDTHSIRE